MIFSMLADLVVVAHLVFVLFVVLGALLALRWPLVAWLHLPAATWGAFIEFSGRVCPLTPLEIWLRRRAGGEGYAGGFVEHHLIPILYPADLTQDVQLQLGTLVVLVNVGIYGWLWLRHRARGRDMLRERDG